jgi:hypothetical protein
MGGARFVPGRRARRALVVATVLLSALLGVLLDARLRATRSERLAAVARLTGLPDLALSSSARWLRHPSQAEPGAPFSDVPAGLDVDPAGALIGPPHPVVEAGAPEAAVVRRGGR